MNKIVVHAEEARAIAAIWCEKQGIPPTRGERAATRWYNTTIQPKDRTWGALEQFLRSSLDVGN
ncbi:hypothetical protein [Bordetella bronchiseptica]|uniref:hypothetical protein n=1 Tax=Bordetella bronchiseptica TaxID=518 RepID=UPI001268567A|nr:hypothetical protein [Bordetella bronchiseptica]